MRLKPPSNRAKRQRIAVGGRRALLDGPHYDHVNTKLRGFLLPQQLRTIGANERMARLLRAKGPWLDELRPQLIAVFSVQRKLKPDSARDRYQRMKRGSRRK